MTKRDFVSTTDCWNNGELLFHNLTGGVSIAEHTTLQQGDNRFCVFRTEDAYKDGTWVIGYSQTYEEALAFAKTIN